MKSRATKQKETISSEIEKFRTYFSADDLFHAVHKKDHSIGMATIYRYLKRDSNLHQFSCGRKTVYSNEKSHHHFSCLGCGKTFHLQIKKLDGIHESLPGSISFLQINVSGYCKGCSPKP